MTRPGPEKSIVKRANDGRKAARARGPGSTADPSSNTHQRAEAQKRLLAGENARALSRSYSVHRTAISRLRDEAPIAGGDRGDTTAVAFATKITRLAGS